MSQYFPKPFRIFGGYINVKVDISNYATKTDLKNVTHVDSSSFAAKTNFVLNDLGKISDVVKHDVAKKKAVCDKSVAKVNNIDTSEFVLKTKYQTDKAELGKKIPDVSNLVKKAKLTELENKIPDVSNLETKTALTAVENKIPRVSDLVKRTDYDTKTTEIEKRMTDHNHDKCIATPDFNTFAADVFNARLARAKLITKSFLIIRYQVLILKLKQIK